MSKCDACVTPCENSWCSFTEMAIVTCGLCGAKTERPFKEACEKGPLCCPTGKFEIEVKE